jgi:UDP-N-acetylglucosamine 2-epimerase (non-hydrolysing)
MTVLGTRPEIIRLSLIIDLLDQLAEHTLLHTGQNYDDRLNELFFREMGIRKPDIFLDVRSTSFGEQAGQILARIEPLLRKNRPDRLLILGDTNSALSAIVARRLGIPVYHMEAGNRCFDFRVPEEINRRIIDHISTVLMPYTERSRANLIREGIPSHQIFVTGNPIKQVMDHYRPQIESSAALHSLGLREKHYFLVTMHRAENVDFPERLASLLNAFDLLHQDYGFPLVCSLHPRTRAKAAEFGITLDRPGLRFVEPFGFFDFVRLERDAFCLLTDSGTVQEEGCILRVPNVTIRDVTERPETVECGSNVLAGCDPATIRSSVKLVTQQDCNWNPPPEYLAPQVAATVVRLLLGYQHH